MRDPGKSLGGADAFERTAARLCRASQAQPADAFAELDWPDALPPEAWCMSPELISLYGTPAFEGLSEAERKRLALLETVNFFSLNVHGERWLLAGLKARLAQPACPATAAYLPHFHDEEERHMAWFERFCLQYAGKLYPDRSLALEPASPEDQEHLAFFAKAMLFETMVDQYNSRMARDHRLHPLVRGLHRLHHREEARHLAFGRQLLRRLAAAQGGDWTDRVRARLGRRLTVYIEQTWARFFNPQVYRDAGLSAAFETRRQALAHPATRRRRDHLLAPCHKLISDLGLTSAEAPS